ncbi:MAG TPA: M20/M25/M40 family metallo-hydrolase [Pyrinomonadaceae bacterium]|nr:M20/M25/M40 family metallo-hydrolase [Pyrinomonadaceae bacterium]
MNVFELTRKLIDIPSVTGAEANIGYFLAAYLESFGYQVERQAVANERFNVIATTLDQPRVVLSTHMDTVPPHIRSSEDEEKIYGRGACDAKGIIAAQIFAAERLRAEGVNEIGLLFTVDEETGSGGARVANKQKHRGETDYMINGEPTDNKLAVATKGSLRFILTTQGRAAHSAYPEQGESAIEKLLDVLQDLRNVDWPSDVVLGDTTLNIGVIGGGTRPNVIPDNASAELQMRLVSNVPDVKHILETAIADRARTEYLSENEPVHLHVVSTIGQCVVRFTTDIPYLSNWGTPLLLGPGSIFNAHTDHEFILKEELTQAVELYASLARSLVVESSQVDGASVSQGVVR